eukprot:jgi/Mesen1/5587/ME000281S04652
MDAEFNVGDILRVETSSPGENEGGEEGQRNRSIVAVHCSNLTGGYIGYQVEAGGARQQTTPVRTGLLEPHRDVDFLVQRPGPTASQGEEEGGEGEAGEEEWQLVVAAVGLPWGSGPADVAPAWVCLRSLCLFPSICVLVCV